MAYLNSFTPYTLPQPTTTDQLQQGASQQGTFGDSVDAFQAGALSAVGGILDFAGAKGFAKNFYGWADDQYNQMSDAGRESIGKEIFTTDENGNFAFGDGASDLDTWLLGFANMAGQFLPTAIPGAGAAGAVARVASLGAKGKAVANAAGMGAFGGAAGTGQAMEQARSEYMQIPDELKAESDLFKNAIRSVHQQNPDWTYDQKWDAADAMIADKVAEDVRTDPKVLLANFGASAIADPIIGRALTGARLAKGGIRRSAAKGFAVEGGTEAAQAGVSQYGVNEALQPIDNRDAMQGVAVAAANEGILGGAFGGAAGGMGGAINRQPKVRDPAADAIRESNPALAEAFDGIATQQAATAATLDQIIAGNTAGNQQTAAPAQADYVQQRRSEIEQAISELDTTTPGASNRVAELNKQLQFLESGRVFKSKTELMAGKSYRDAVRNAEATGIPVEIVPVAGGFKWRQKAPAIQPAMQQVNAPMAQLDTQAQPDTGSLLAPGNAPVVQADPAMQLPTAMQQELASAPVQEEAAANIAAQPEVNANATEENAGLGETGTGSESNLLDRGSEVNGVPARDSGLQQKLSQPAAEPVAGSSENTHVADADALSADTLINVSAAVVPAPEATAQVETPAAQQEPVASAEPTAELTVQAEPAMPTLRERKEAARKSNRPVESKAVSRSTGIIGAKAGDTIRIDGNIGYADSGNYYVEQINNDGTVFISNDQGTTNLTVSDLVAAQRRGEVKFSKLASDPAAKKPTTKEPVILTEATEQDAITGEYSHTLHSDVTATVSKTDKGYSIDWGEGDVQQFTGKAAGDKVQTALKREQYKKPGSDIQFAAGNYSAMRNQKAKGVPAAQVEMMVKQFMRKLNNASGIKVKVLRSQKEAELAFNKSLSGNIVRGAYNDKTKTAYLIADNFDSIEHARRTLAHEVIAHGGLQSIIGPVTYQQFLERINTTRTKPSFRRAWAGIIQDYGSLTPEKQAEEFFARFVEDQPETGSLKYWWKALLRWLNNQLAKVGITKAGDPDMDVMRNMMDSIVQGFKSGRAPRRQMGKSVDYDKTTDYEKSGNNRFNAIVDSLISGETSEAEAALYHPEIGEIDLVMGEAGSADKNYSDGYGLAKILVKHPEVNPYQLLDIVAGAKKKKQRGNTVELEDNKTKLIVKLDWQGDEKKWLLTAFEPASRRQSIDAAPGTPSDSTLSEGEANNSIADSSDNEQGDLDFSLTTGTDTRTAKEKLGLGEQADETLKEKATARYRETADTLKSSKFWQRLNEGIFDGMAGIKQAEESVGVNDPNRQGYVSARLASGLADVLHGVFNYGAPEWRNGVVARKADTKGLLEVFSSLGDDLNNWLAWMGANRAEKLMTEGRENNLTADDIAELKSLADGKETKFEEVRQEYNKINSAIIDLAQQAGLISDAQRSGFDEEWYVPFFRDMDIDPEMQGIAAMVHGPKSKNGIANQNAQLKELKGGKQSTKDLLENIIQRQSTLIDAALKNHAMLEIVGNLSGTDYMQPVTSPEIAALSQTDLNLLSKVKVMRDGKPEAYAVSDPALLRGLLQINDAGSKSLFNRLGRSAKRFLTAGITLSPDFIVKNFVRDAAHAWMVNKDDFTFGADSIKGLRKAFKEDEAYRDLIFSGAAFQGGYIHGADPEAATQQVRRALKAKGLTVNEVNSYMDSLVTKGGQLLEKYRNVSDKVENANRLMTYEAALRAGKSTRQAAFESKDLMDYSLKGNFALINSMIDFLPFFNARLQGLSKLVRAAKAGDGDRVLKVLSANLAMKGMKVAAFSLALAAMNDDDERYQELADWDKDSNWHFWLGDDHIRIPKPFELGIVFGTFPERMLHYGTGTQPASDLGKAVGHAVFNTLALNPIPQLALPAVEVMVNRSFFKDSSIEGMADENRQPGDRYNAYTSEVAKQLGQLFNVSPKKIEHLVKGYTGTIGGYVLSASDIVARQMLGIESADTPISRYPVVKAFYQGDAPKTNTKFQQEFYDALDAAGQAYGSYKRAAEEGDTERQRKILEANKEKLGSRIQLNRLQRQLSELNKQAERVNNNNALSGAQKRERLDEITRRKNAIYHAGYVRFNLGEW